MVEKSIKIEQVEEAQEIINDRKDYLDVFTKLEACDGLEVRIRQGGSHSYSIKLPKGGEEYGAFEKLLVKATNIRLNDCKNALADFGITDENSYEE